MNIMRTKRSLAVILLMLLAGPTGRITAEETHSMDMHAHAKMPEQGDHISMKGLYGPYPMSRESSGTSWQPESTPMEGVHAMFEEWLFMLHGFCNSIVDMQAGPRGDEMVFSTNMLMFMMERPLLGGTWGARSMISFEPTLGRDGYPLLLQTGETADGVTPLVDRQHPHDFVMELATTYSYPLSSDSSVFFYFGIPGEPALGPTTFMHRASAEPIPDAPITHHWLDSTHISYGVITFGYIKDGIKIENSFFRGRESDQFRWNIETPRFDSYAVRFTINPTQDLACQISYGHLISPEQLEPDTDADRLTASITYNKNFKNATWQTTLAYGHNWKAHGHTLPAFLVESAATFGNATRYSAGENSSARTSSSGTTSRSPGRYSRSGRRRSDAFTISSRPKRSRWVSATRQIYATIPTGWMTLTATHPGARWCLLR